MIDNAFMLCKFFEMLLTSRDKGKYLKDEIVLYILLQTGN